jgi:uncharacterized protein DUF5317
MLIGAALLFVLCTVPLMGGRIGALADVHFEAVWALPAGLGLQILIVYVLPEAPGELLNAAHVASYVLALIFVVANRRVPGLLVIAAGGALNFVAIAANGGVMPASRSALAAAGLADTPGQFASSAGVEHPMLGFLGDVFYVPASWPVHNVFSVGDVLIVAGAAIALHVICRSRLCTLVPRRRPA